MSKEQDERDLIKKTVLSYLQQNGFQLRQQGAADAIYADEPSRLILTVHKEFPVSQFKNGITYADVKIPVEIVELDSEKAVVDFIPDQGAKNLGNPSSEGRGAAYDAWKKRNKAVKIVGE